MPPADDSPAAASQSQTYTKILQGRYELGRVLGRGGSSKVYRARDLRTGVHVAVKAVRKPHPPCSPEDAAAARRSVEREILALRRVQGHPHVMRLHEVLASRTTVYLVLDLARGGTVLSAVERSGPAAEPVARRLFGQLVSALAYAHARGVFHRDVKTDNLLLDEHGDVRLTDFGLCAFADGHQLGPDGLAETTCGTPAYVAPEILLRKRYDPRKADVWSCGVVLFVLTAGYLPFNDGNLMGMYRKICAGKFRCPRWCSSELRCLLGRMLDPEPDTRIKIAEILDHPWLQQDGGKIPPARPSSQMPAPEVAKWEVELDQTRELNAFDILTFASGCDLAGLIGPLPDRLRVVVHGVNDARSVLDTVEELGRGDGFTVRRKDGAGYGGALLEDMDGKFVAQVRVHRLHQQVMMVEAERASVDEAPNFWNGLQSRLKLSAN